MAHPKFIAMSDIRLSTGAVERAGGIVIDARAGGDALVVSNPPPTSDAVIAAVTAAVKPRPVMLLGTVAPYTPAFQARHHSAPGLGLATAHGIAAALKAEAPPRAPHDALAIQADSMGFEAPASHHARMAKQRAEQRTARKQADRRKARRGWR